MVEATSYVVQCMHYNYRLIKSETGSRAGIGPFPATSYTGLYLEIVFAGPDTDVIRAHSTLLNFSYL